MEFKSLKNIETSFRQLRLFGIVYLCVCTLLVFFPYGRLTLLRKRNGRRFMSWMKESR